MDSNSPSCENGRDAIDAPSTRSTPWGPLVEPQPKIYRQNNPWMSFLQPSCIGRSAPLLALAGGCCCRLLQFRGRLLGYSTRLFWLPLSQRKRKPPPQQQAAARTTTLRGTHHNHARAAMHECRARPPPEHRAVSRRCPPAHPPALGQASVVLSRRGAHDHGVVPLAALLAVGREHVIWAGALLAAPPAPRSQAQPPGAALLPLR